MGQMEDLIMALQHEEMQERLAEAGTVLTLLLTFS